MNVTGKKSGNCLPTKTDVRRTGIGGSDIAAVLGLSPWRTPLQVWLEKTGREAYTPDAQALERMQWGARLEDIVARHYAEVHKAKIQRVNTTMRMPQHPYIMGNIDRAVCMHGTAPRWRDQLGRLTGAEKILEVKTAAASALSLGEWGSPGTDEIPKHYWLQVLWYLGIAKVEVGDVAVLFGGQTYREYAIRLDEALFGDVVQFAVAWWQKHVVGDEAPAPMSAADVLKLFPADSGRSVDATPELRELYFQAVALKRQIDEATKKYEAAVDQIKVALGSASELLVDGRPVVTWKATAAPKRIDWQAVAMKAGATQDMIAACTVEGQGTRRFLLKE
ncbi:MAG: YqaJ viral recombinase family protein [Caldilinea sp.]|nr:YqaJ viral recombinase family protein [Caldilinea sp.]MDW8440941.1 YqaJ viral recombinase family protein [Caldilineaceae bacterium]